MFGFELSPYRLHFRETAVTSRESMDFKDTYILKVWKKDNPKFVGLNEVPVFKGLSPEYSEDFFARASLEIEKLLNGGGEHCGKMSSVNFGVESALASLENGSQSEIFPSWFTRREFPLSINGLIWMGGFDEMLKRIEKKRSERFTVIKLKIGGIDFKEELRLLEFIRAEYPSDEITIRLDANGSFSRYAYQEARQMLKLLSGFHIHSIEQPFSVNDIENTVAFAKSGIIPVALDEQLTGVRSAEEKEKLIKLIDPDFIVLKPSLCGGFNHTREWIDTARSLNKGWWITSALESAIGLNAIAQFTATMLNDNEKTFPQGLGTGELYVNDFPSSLRREGEFLYFKG